MRGGGSPVEGGRSPSPRRAGPAALAIALLFVSLTITSCGASLAADIRADSSAMVEFSVEMPAPVADKLRRLGAAGGGTYDPASPLFNLAAIRAGIAENPELSLQALTQPSPESLRGRILVVSLPGLASMPEMKDSGTLAYAEGADWKELRLLLRRGANAGLAALLPGLDPGLLEALSPPAIAEEGEAVEAEDYRAMLKSVFGTKGLAALEAASVDVELKAPTAVIASGGGRLEERKLTAKLPIIDLLLLEKPIELRLRWKK